MAQIHLLYLTMPQIVIILMITQIHLIFSNDDTDILIIF